jgi:hypothetical protein
MVAIVDDTFLGQNSQVAAVTLPPREPGSMGTPQGPALQLVPFDVGLSSH